MTSVTEEMKHELSDERLREMLAAPLDAIITLSRSADTATFAALVTEVLAAREALKLPREIACRMREYIQNEGGHMTDRERWDGLHGQSMRLLGWEVSTRALKETTNAA